MKPKTDIERILLTLAGYGGAFCFSLALLTVCLGVLTTDSIYSRWSIGLVVAGGLLWFSFLVDWITERMDQ